MFELVDIEQVNAWLRRVGVEGRTFDYLHGFMTGLACAPREYENYPVEILRSALSNEEPAALAEKGLAVDDVDEMLADLYWETVEELDDGSFRPYIGGRYLRRIKADSPCHEWCEGFFSTFALYEEPCREDEELKGLFVIPLLLLEGNVGLSAEELPPTLEAARSGFIENFLRLRSYFAAEDDDEEPTSIKG